MNTFIQTIAPHLLPYWAVSGLLMMVITAFRDYRGKLAQPADHLIMIANMICGFFLLPVFIVRWGWNAIVKHRFI